LELAEHIWAGVQAVNPGQKPPNLEKWANTVRLMREQDRRTPERIRQVFDWANADRAARGKFPGWAFVILSVDNLREKFDKITSQMRSAGNGSPPLPDRPMSPEEAADFNRSLEKVRQQQRKQQEKGVA
jgi:hypothetical protein